MNYKLQAEELLEIVYGQSQNSVPPCHSKCCEAPSEDAFALSSEFSTVSRNDCDPSSGLDRGYQGSNSLLSLSVQRRAIQGRKTLFQGSRTTINCTGTFRNETREKKVVVCWSLFRNHAMLMLISFNSGLKRSIRDKIAHSENFAS